MSSQLLCPICVDKTPFVGEEALHTHLALVHYKCRPYPCALCAGALRFPTETGLRQHVEMEHGVLKYRVSPLFYCPVALNPPPPSRSTTPPRRPSSTAWAASTHW